MSARSLGVTDRRGRFLAGYDDLERGDEHSGARTETLEPELLVGFNAVRSTNPDAPGGTLALRLDR